MTKAQAHPVTTTRTVDQFGNISYAVRRDGTVIANIDKTCSGYQLTLPSGSYVPVRSIKAGLELLDTHDRIMAMSAV
jgi:hypothetical protein